jgi:hypothetical protein
MRTVYKYTLDVVDMQTIEVRKEAGTTPKIVHTGLDASGVPCIWMELTPGTYVEKYEIHIIGTGNPVTGTKSHVGCFVQSRFVWHVYV